MKGLPEELIYVLMFGAVLLLQYLMKRFGPQPEQVPILQDAPEVEVPVQAAVEAVSLPVLADTRWSRSIAPKVSAERARHRFSRQSLIGNRRDVQNAIVIATILGPCRSFKPHDGQ